MSEAPTEITKLTQSEFDVLLVYNMSLPTEQYKGKRWRKDVNGTHYMGEYGKVVGKDRDIKWTRIEIVKL